MKKKLMMVAVLLGALTLGACVDDNESQSVTDARKAKAAQLDALTKKANAEAEAALIQANAEKAYKEAMAEYQKSQAALNNANAANIEFELQKAKEQYERTIETIKAQEEYQLWLAKKNAAEAEQDFLEIANIHTASLYRTYQYERKTLVEHQSWLKYYTGQLRSLEAGLIDYNAYYESTIAKNNLTIERLKADISFYKAYEGYDSNELRLAANNAQDAYEKALKEQGTALTANTTAKTAYNDAKDDFTSEESTIAAVAAVKKLEGLYPRNGITYENTTITFNNLVPSANSEDLGKVVADVTNAPTTTSALNVTLYSLGKHYDNSVVKRALAENVATETEAVADAEEALGKEAAGDVAATGAYKTLADAEKAQADAAKALADAEAELKAAGDDATKQAAAQVKIDAAEKLLDGDRAAASGTAAEKGTKQVLKEAQDALATAMDDVEEAKADLEKAKEIQTAYAAVVKALSEGEELTAYKKAVEDLKAGAAKTYMEANKAYVDAVKASKDAEAEKDIVNQLYYSGTGIDIALAIKEAEESIANYNKTNAELNADINEQNDAVAEVERNVALYTDLVETQTSIVALAKKALDDYLASLDKE